MRLLLDTHAAIWLVGDNAKLGPIARHSILEADEVHFSAAVPWEAAVKRQRGRLDVGAAFAAQLTTDGYIELPITAAHGEAAGALPRHHGDPFDRVIIAQARIERLTVVTADPWFRHYDVGLLDATK